MIDSLSGDKLYRNDGGHFTDVSAKAGLHQNPLTFGLGIAVADINNDGWDDIYVTNDYNEPDYLYIITMMALLGMKHKCVSAIFRNFPWVLILLIIIMMDCRIS